MKKATITTVLSILALQGCSTPHEKSIYEVSKPSIISNNKDYDRDAAFYAKLDNWNRTSSKDILLITPEWQPSPLPKPSYVSPQQTIAKSIDGIMAPEAKVSKAPANPKPSAAEKAIVKTKPIEKVLKTAEKPPYKIQEKTAVAQKRPEAIKVAEQHITKEPEKKPEASVEKISDNIAKRPDGKEAFKENQKQDKSVNSKNVADQKIAKKGQEPGYKTPLKKPNPTADEKPERTVEAPKKAEETVAVKVITKKVDPKIIAIQSWSTKPGSTLKKTVKEWAAKENYNIEWAAIGLDYPIERQMTFNGDFESVVIQIFSLYEKADRSFSVTGFRKERVIQVKEKLKINSTRP